MALIRFIVFVLIAGSLVLLFLQNRSPVIALKFLGMQTQALPLAIWIVVAIALGILTSLLIALLLQAAYFFAGRRLQKQTRGAAERNRVTEQARTPFWSRRSTPSSESNWVDDGEEEEPTFIPPPNPSQPYKANASSYEVKQEPKSSSQTGSVYSYSFREQSPRVNERPPKPEVNRSTGDAMDAEYRVLIPPPVEKAVAQDNDWDDLPDGDDDWDFEDDKPRSRP
jgi:hypothetical protein